MDPPLSELSKYSNLTEIFPTMSIICQDSGLGYQGAISPWGSPEWILGRQTLPGLSPRNETNPKAHFSNSIS